MGYSSYPLVCGISEPSTSGFFFEPQATCAWYVNVAHVEPDKTHAFQVEILRFDVSTIFPMEESSRLSPRHGIFVHWMLRWLFCFFLKDTFTLKLGEMFWFPLLTSCGIPIFSSKFETELSQKIHQRPGKGGQFNLNWETLVRFPWVFAGKGGESWSN